MNITIHNNTTAIKPRREAAANSGVGINCYIVFMATVLAICIWQTMQIHNTSAAAKLLRDELNHSYTDVRL